MSGAEVIVIRQNRWMKTFKKMGATSPASAIQPESIRGTNSWLFRRMIARGVFLVTADGRYYMDEEAAAGFRQVRRKRVLIAVIIAVIAVVVLLLTAGGRS